MVKDGTTISQANGIVTKKSPPICICLILTFSQPNLRHVGYNSDGFLPPSRGFKRGLYSHQGLQYYSRGFRRSLSKLDTFFEEPSNDVKKRRKLYLGANYKVQIHDTYEIEGYAETPAYIGDPSYGEDLYTEHIKSYIAARDGNKPFFIYYSQWTPHSNIVQPPVYRPDGSKMNYTVCYDAFPNRTNETCSLLNDTRCVFCKQGILFISLYLAVSTNINKRCDFTVYTQSITRAKTYKKLSKRLEIILI